ncbi:MAG: hypothetical protein EP329_28310 [Deltaproteobacteria bacterium]|nr:MAG: hypothetical protein EP329_28310 [Deltaproteobacteria bacterium]
MTRHTVALTLAAALLAGGCGSLDDPGAEAVVTIHGALEATTGVSIDGEVRVAFLWFSQRFSTAGGERYTVAQEARVEPQFPASFSLTLGALPPEDALVDAEDSLFGAIDPAADQHRFAVGAVVAYVDTNGNGRLDLIASDATSSVDRIIAASGRSSVVYVEGPAATLSGLDGELPPGFSYVVSSCPLVEDVSCALDSQIVDITESLVLTVDDSPQLAGLLCAAITSPQSTLTELDGEGPPPAVPASPHAGDPNEPSVSCWTDGAIHRGSCEWVRDTTLCAVEHVACVRETWPAPAGDAERLTWPCFIPDWCDDTSVANVCQTEGVAFVAQLDGFVNGVAPADGYLYVSMQPEPDVTSPTALFRVPKTGGAPEQLYVPATGWHTHPMGVSAGRVLWSESRFESIESADDAWLPVETRACDAPKDDFTGPRCVAVPPSALWGLDVDGAWITDVAEGGDPDVGPFQLVRRPLDGGPDTLIAQSSGFAGVVVRDDEVVWLEAADETVHAAARDGSGATIVRDLGALGLAGDLLVHADDDSLVLAALDGRLRDSLFPVVVTFHGVPREGGEASSLGTRSFVPYVAFGDDGLYWSPGGQTVERIGYTGGEPETVMNFGAGDGEISPALISLDAARVFWVDWRDGGLWSAPRTPGAAPR